MINLACTHCQPAARSSPWPRSRRPATTSTCCSTGSRPSGGPAAGRPADPGGATEGAVLAALAHPNLVAVYDTGVHDGRPFLVLEDIPGRSLEEYAAAEKPDPRRAAELVAGAARGLGAAHGHGV